MATTHRTDRSGGRSATVRVVRVAGRVVGTLGTYVLELDGEPVGGIKSGEVKNFAVAPGEHRLTVEVPHRHAVADTMFTAREHEIVFLECAPRGGPFSAILRLVLRERQSVDIHQWD
ncbi:MAG: hypothetical protein WB765_15380 [Acidimicrobiales bacterium]